MTYASLFSGVEGFGRGFEQAGFTPIWTCEIDKKCQAVLRYQYPNLTNYDDITKEIELRDARMLERLIAEIKDLSPWGLGYLKDAIKDLGPVQPELMTGKEP